MHSNYQKEKMHFVNFVNTYLMFVGANIPANVWDCQDKMLAKVKS